MAVMTCGDGGTVLGMTRAKRAVANGPLNDGCHRFKGLEEAPQEFHKHGIVLQVFIIMTIYMAFYSGSV
jgi:hypothetical protein